MLSLAPVSAASLTNTYLRTSRMAAGQTTTMRLVFKTASAGATALTINMNGADSTTWSASSGSVHSGTMTKDTSTCATELGVSGLPGGSLAVTGGNGSNDGHTIAISSITALSATTTYCIDLTNSDAVTLPTAGEYHPTITESGGATDSITVALRTVSNDQIVVNAVVPPTFNFAISGCTSNTDNFTANLSTSAPVSTSGCTVTVNTNAANGWIAWAKDASTGLHSTAASKTIASTTPGTNATITSAAEGYLMGVTSITQGSGGGTTSATNAYGNGSGGVAGSNQGSGLDGTLRQIVSSSGTAGNASFVVKESASIVATTPAGNDYTDTITLIGAGNF